MLKYATMIAALALSSACGSDSDEKNSAPPPDVADGDGEAFALENGEYFVADVRELNDGCGKKPLAGNDPITQVPFILINEANGFVAIDFCIYEETSVRGAIRGNVGTLATIHNNRRNGSGESVRQFDQECRVAVSVTADNAFEGRFTETQRNRNAAQRLASGVDQTECTTSFAFKMTKRD